MIARKRRPHKGPLRAALAGTLLCGLLAWAVPTRCATEGAVAAGVATRPNIVLIMVDDMRQVEMRYTP